MAASTVPTLITSAAGYGKTHEAIQGIKRLKRRDPLAPVWVLLPTELQVNAFRARAMTVIGEDTLFAVEFFDFYSLNARLLELFDKPQRRAQDATRYRILRHIITAEQAQLRHFGAIAETPGFVQLIAAFILELKQALIQPEAFAATAQTDKDHDLALLYGAYQTYLRDNDLVDREGEGWLALAELERDQAKLLPVKLLIADGYDQFSVVQTRLLTHLAGRIPQTILTLTYEPHRAEAAHRRFAQTRARLLSEATRADAAPTGAVSWRESAAAPAPDYARDAALTHLTAHLFQSGAERLHDASAVRLIEAPDRRREVQRVMHEVKRLLLDGTPAEEIAIVARDADPYTPYFLESAISYGIPLFFNRGLPLRRNPAVASFLALIELARNQFRRREVMDALHSPYLLPPDLTPAQIDALERLTRRYSVVRWAKTWLEAITLAGKAKTDDDSEPYTEAQIAARTEAMTALHDSVEKFFARITPPRNGTARALITWLEGLIGADPRAEEPEDAPANTAPADFGMIARIRNGSEGALLGRDLAAMKRLKGVFVELLTAAELVNPGAEFTWETFRRDLLLAIDQASIDPPRSTNRLGRVLLATVYAVRGLGHDHLFVLGLSEGEFPAATPEDAIYLDTERTALHERGFDLATRAESADESSLFYELTALARKTLTLLRPYLDDKSNDWPASPYWRAVREVVRVEPLRLPIAPRPVPDEAAQPSEFLLALATHLSEASTLTPTLTAALDWVVSSPAARAWANARRGRGIERNRGRSSSVPDVYSGQLSDPTLIAMVAGELGVSKRWSASQLNEYGTCPYQFFAKRLLRLEALKEPEEGMDAQQHGSMIHRILELTYKQIAAKDEPLSITPPNRDRALMILEAVMDEVFANAPFEFGFRETRLWIHEQAEYRRQLRDLIMTDFAEKNPLSRLAKGTRHTRYHEIGFGGKRTSESDALPDTAERAQGVEVRLDGAAGPLRVSGLIDRVDQVGGQLIVVDYKTGSKAIPHADMLGGRNVQMLIYLRAAEQIFPDQEIIGGAFWHTKKGSLSGETRLTSDADVLTEAAENVHQRILDGREGVFTSTPSKPEQHKCVRHCDYFQLCRLSAKQGLSS
jgi:ATP-dependent helicase/nuclease subunit B